MNFSNALRHAWWNMCEQLKSTSRPSLKAHMQIGQKASFRPSSWPSMWSQSDCGRASTLGAALTRPRNSANVLCTGKSALRRKYPHVLQMDDDASLASPQHAHRTVAAGAAAAAREAPLDPAAPVGRGLGRLCADALLPPAEYTTIALPGSLNRRAISACSAAASIDALCFAPAAPAPTVRCGRMAESGDRSQRSARGIRF